MWTRFMDMSSGGGRKEEWNRIYIEAPEEEAKLIFYNRFGHSSERVSCTCCGEDYSIDSEETLEQVTGYDRGCAYDEKSKKYLEKADNGEFSFNKNYISIKDFIKKTEKGDSFFDCIPHFVFAKDIKPGERKGELPKQGYVWHD